MLQNDVASEWLGMRLVADEPGRAVVELTVRPEHLNGHGITHGGIVFALADTAFAIACNEDEFVTVAAGAEVTFERVQSDSRCPMDVFCVWAGDAAVAVTLHPPKGAAESRELHTQPTGSQLSYASYTITLTALAPYPQSSREIPPSAYIATFVVSVR